MESTEQRRRVLVTGATGRQGGGVARALLHRGHQVVALTRHPGGRRARALADKGARIVGGDWNDLAGLRAAFEGTDAAFLMGTPFEAGLEFEIRSCSAMIEAARHADVSHVLYSSVAGAGSETGVPHFDSKHRVERHLAGSGMPWSVIAPVAFMDFLNPDIYLPRLREGVLSMALPAHRSLQYIAPDDIGAFAARLIERGQSVFGRRYEIAGDEATGPEAAEILSRASGRDISYVETPLSEVAAFSADLAAMFEWLANVGYSVDRQRLADEFPEMEWQSLETWVMRQDWEALGPRRVEAGSAQPRRR